MNATTEQPSSRHQRLASLLKQDPGNALLLADAADAAMTEGLLDAADSHIAAGHRIEGPTAAWRFREASLRIAQRRLGDARTLLTALLAEEPPRASVIHNLAYVEFLEGRFDACISALRPWVHGERPLQPGDAAALHVLWVRALHHLEKLEEAWSWIEARGSALAPAAAGPASLVALDLSRMEDAARLSAAALANDPFQAEAGIAAAGVALARKDASEARALLARVIGRHPHQARAWSTQGFVDFIDSRFEAARAHFRKAIELSPDHATVWVGLGWTEVMLGDLPAAASAFREAVKCDAASAEAHGALAAALAMQGDSAGARPHADEALRLDPASASAQLAQAVLAGAPVGLDAMQRLARQLLD